MVLCCGDKREGCGVQHQIDLRMDRCNAFR